MELINLVSFREFPVKNKDYIDDDFNYIVFEFCMNFSLESVRSAYFENKKNKPVSENILRELGYDDDDILRCCDD